MFQIQTVWVDEYLLFAGSAFLFALVIQVILAQLKKAFWGWIVPVLFSIASAFLVFWEINTPLAHPDYYALAVFIAPQIILLLLFYIFRFRRLSKCS